ncbi:MAG TPA: RNA methyltransferase [Azospirillaceae bacterium]|nr:RNA methyltransferase [Azospirillaceae bacterium]
MSGTNKRELAKFEADGAGPAIILVEPQLGENIGACARAMLNCGLTDLRIVNPRDGWPNEKAVSASAGATVVLDRARVFESVPDAIADLHKVYATCPRKRDMVKVTLNARSAAKEIRAHWEGGRNVGILFGPERTGLFNDDIALAERVIAIPLNPGFSSLNLAQAVLVVGYEWFQTRDDLPPDETLFTGNSRPATSGEMQNLFDHLEGELDQTGFYTSEEKRPSMVRNVRNTLHRAHMTEQEVRTFHGIIAALVGRKKQRG